MRGMQILQILPKKEQIQPMHEYSAKDGIFPLPAQAASGLADQNTKLYKQTQHCNPRQQHVKPSFKLLMHYMQLSNTWFKTCFCWIWRQQQLLL
jgi:hypothetical protein